MFDDVGMGEGEDGSILRRAVHVDAADVVGEVGEDVAPARAKPVGFGFDIRGDLVSFT